MVFAVDGSFLLGIATKPTLPIVVGVLLIGLGVFVWRVRKSVYAVQLVTNSGEVQAVRDGNYEYIMAIVDALNQAMLR